MRRLREWVVGAALAGLAGTVVTVRPDPVQAQQGEAQVWIQIEAKNSRPRIEERLRVWSETLPNVTGFVMASGWYAAALGPYSRQEAADVLNELRLLRAIPSDSFIADARVYRSALEPLGPAPVEALPPPISGAQPAPTTPIEVSPLGIGTEAALPGPRGLLDPESPAEARRAESQLTRDERIEIQRALLWAGVLRSGVDGVFGPGTRGAVAAWQEAMRREPTGYLTRYQREELLGSWRAELSALGLDLVRDEEAGIEAELPLALVAFDTYAPPFATYKAKGDSGMEIRLISQPGDQQALAELYDRLQTSGLLTGEGPRSRRPRGFEITALSDMAEGHAWAELSEGVIKGYLVTARRADGARTARVLRGLQTSFRSLPGQVLDPGLVPLEESAKAAMLTGIEKRQPKRAGSGVFATPTGLVVTAQSVVEACGKITLDGGVEAQILAADPGAGVALLQPRAALAPRGVARFAESLPQPGSEVAVAGYSFGADLPLPSMTFGRFEAPTGLDGQPGRARLSLPALMGDIGGPVLGEDGRVIGILQAVPASPGRELPETVSYLAPAPTVIAGLQARMPGLQSLPPAGGRMVAEDLSQIGNAMAVQVLCWN